MSNTKSLRDTVSKEIDGINYEIKLLNTSAAFDSFQSVMKLLLPAGGAALDGALDENLFEGDNTFSTSAMLLVRQMGEVDILKTIKLLTDGMTADGEVIDFENYFKGDLLLLVKILEFAVRENYGSLFILTGLKNKFMTFINELTQQTVEGQPLAE